MRPDYLVQSRMTFPDFPLFMAAKPSSNNKIICKGLTMQGIYGRKMDNWHQMSYMVQGGLDLTPVITHRFHYTFSPAAFSTKTIRPHRLASLAA